MAWFLTGILIGYCRIMGMVYTRFGHFYASKNPRIFERWTLCRSGIASGNLIDYWELHGVAAACWA